MNDGIELCVGVFEVGGSPIPNTFLSPPCSGPPNLLNHMDQDGNSSHWLMGS